MDGCVKENIMPNKYFGYKVRKPYKGEDDYFKNNPNVTGMAAEDDQIIFNPYSKNIDLDAVGKNEASRLWMRKKNIDPPFKLTEKQMEFFKGTPYENDPTAAKQSIIGRIISGDPSAQDVTPEQIGWADRILQGLKQEESIRRYE